MRVGKTKVFLCDFCGYPIQGERDTFTLEDKKTRDYCRTTLCGLAALDERCRGQHIEEVRAKSRENTRDEINLIYKNVCPSDQKRLRQILVRVF